MNLHHKPFALGPTKDQRLGRTIHALHNIGLAIVLLSLAALSARADGLADNDPANVRRVPKLGVEVPAADRQKLTAGLAELQQSIDRLKSRQDASITALLPDVEIYHRAVHDALVYQEFFDPAEITDAYKLLEEGQERAKQLAANQAPWTTATGLVVRGYVSRIDGSVQPYGLVVPESYAAGGSQRHRLDIWFHGRGETLSELNFLRSRRVQPGQFTPRDTIVLHPYGRYSNAFKFAGETDVLEALDSVRGRYRIDDQRIAVRGFSMGGAACWQFAVHFPDRWVGANPGAGFAETPEFLQFFQKETLAPTWYERKLWHWYDCTDWALNLFHCPTVAYSGEDDIQKQAADIMATALENEEMELQHIIGPQTAHSYHPQAAAIVDRAMQSIAETGRDRQPLDLHFVTYTLKYNRLAWLVVDGLQQHWERAQVDGMISIGADVELVTSNVSDLTLDMPSGWCPFSLTQPVLLVIDEDEFEAPRPKSDRSWRVSLHRTPDGWRLGRRPQADLVKKHNLQGPIDDALMDSFLFVRPTGQTANKAVGQWAAAELERAIEQWRRHFRGHARVKDDRDVTEEDIATANLVLWGDPQNNTLLAKVASHLPIAWNEESITVDRDDEDAETYSADQHALIAIYPNPLNPDRYVVLNSSFTFREFAYLNNARQVAKLPDWAVVDLRTPPDSLWPGKIVAADFFDETWQLRPKLLLNDPDAEVTRR
ncbi:MAG: prolyl oligopeptidase family serine peptidase [Pirellulales bacterium]